MTTYDVYHKSKNPILHVFTDKGKDTETFVELTADGLVTWIRDYSENDEITITFHRLR